ncbi:MAG: adenylyltransferase/cytidyltransferase family protein [Phycisphaerae bacterium]|nr:adenylyltransferase/cytidyltransferase family protein [Phycisphaerae bacterium]
MPVDPPRGTSALKILSHERLLAEREVARRDGRAVVQCHGCFDIVHPGHVRHLRQAKGHGDVLLVSITGDATMRKGTGRPLIPEELRADNLAALDFVDWVYVEQRETAAELLSEVRPDVYVKGKEYEVNADPRFRAERTAVERGGGRVVFTSGDVVFSSTALIAALERSADPFHARLTALLRLPELDGARLSGLISSFRGRRMLVVGETILDTYVLCDRPEIAGESPIMTLRPLERRGYDGGAAVIARHLAAMGARPVLVTALPDSPASEAVRRRLASEGIEVRAIEVDTPIAEKQRYLVGAQKVMKLNQLEPIVLDAARRERLCGAAAEAARGCDGAIIADFGNGLLSGLTLEKMCTAVRPRVGVMTGDVSGRRAGLLRMAGMDLLCPSEQELRDALANYEEGLSTVAWRLLERTRSRASIVTLGADGLILFDPLPGDAGAGADAFRSRLRGEHVPALAAHAVDPLGCGDALLAAATLAMVAGAGPLAAAFLGSVAAAVEAQRLGNIAVSATDLRHGVVRLHTAHLAWAPADFDAPRIGVPLASTPAAGLRAS